MRLLMLLFAILAWTLAATPAAAQMAGVSPGETFLKKVREGDTAAFLTALEEPGTRIANFRGRSGEGAIHIVVQEKRLRWLGTLLTNDADPNLRDRDQRTALHYATELQDEPMVDLLLRRRADPNLGDRSGETPLMIAVRLRNERLVKLLLDHDADPDMTDLVSGYSARDYAARDNRNPGLLDAIEAADDDVGAVEEGETEDGELKFGPVLR